MKDFETIITDAAREAVKTVFKIEPDEAALLVETPKDPKLGDYSLSLAMKLAGALRRNPMEIGELLSAELSRLLPIAESIDIARPGFINLRLRKSALTGIINSVIEAGDDYGKNSSGKGRKILVEWVSANPTGDLHCGHARNAAWGDCICRMLEASGWDVLREYYVNDAGNQIVKLGQSLVARYFEYFGRDDFPMPEDGYRADDLRLIAAELAEEEGDRWLEADPEERLNFFMAEGKARELRKIDLDLKLYGVRIDSWIHESMFYENDMRRIRACLERMGEMELTYEEDGALWFKSSDYGDEKDRVLRKSDGTLSYLTPDIANHIHKAERGYPLMVNLWGADHHSYVVRMQAALTALGYPKGTLEVILIQMVRMVEDGLEIKMSKRTGNALTIRELCEDIGVDSARWFFASKDVSTHMDLDLNLARSRDTNNPVFYAQYAHSRMCSILRNHRVPEFMPQQSYERLTDEKELQLLKLISEFPSLLAEAAALYKPNKITDYAISLARVFHSYYNSTRVYVAEDPALTNERLGLIKATMIALKNALQLVGVSAPESM